MSKTPAPKGTKRSADELIHIMDMFYKQENDALLCENRRLKKRLCLFELHHQVATSAIVNLREELRAANQESAFRQAIIHEIFVNFPAVHDSYVTSTHVRASCGVLYF